MYIQTYVCFYAFVLGVIVAVWPQKDLGLVILLPQPSEC